MKLRLAPGGALLLIWIGCGGAFTSTDQGSGGVGSTGGSATGGGSGSGGTGTGGGAGSQGSGGSFAGSSVGGSGIGGSGIGGSGVGGSDGTGGTSSTGGAAGRGGGTVDAGLDFTACDGPGQCVAVEASCCATCGTPELVNFVGLNTKHVADYRKEKCPLPVNCPACATGKNPNIAARCNQGHCQAFDVRKQPEYSSCNVIADCHLRAGLGCCVCGGPDIGWVSVNQPAEQLISMAMCAPMTGCAACVSVPPMNYAATCSNHVCGLLMSLPF